FTVCDFHFPVIGLPFLGDGLHLSLIFPGKVFFRRTNTAEHGSRIGGRIAVCCITGISIATLRRDRWGRWFFCQLDLVVRVLVRLAAHGWRRIICWALAGRIGRGPYRRRGDGGQTLIAFPACYSLIRKRGHCQISIGWLIRNVFESEFLRVLGDDS